MESHAPVEDFLRRDSTRLLEDWYDDYHQRTFGIGFREAAGVAPDLPSVFRRWCDATGLRSKVCVEWDYCNKKASMAKVQLCATLGDFVSAILVVNTNSGLTVAVLLVQFGFDSMCACQE
jgi:hypothetical protein